MESQQEKRTSLYFPKLQQIALKKFIAYLTQVFESNKSKAHIGRKLAN